MYASALLPAGILVLALWVALGSCFSIFLCIFDYIEWKMSKHFLAIQIIFQELSSVPVSCEHLSHLSI